MKVCQKRVACPMDSADSTGRLLCFQKTPPWTCIALRLARLVRHRHRKTAQEATVAAKERCGTQSPELALWMVPWTQTVRKIWIKTGQ